MVRYAKNNLSRTFSRCRKEIPDTDIPQKILDGWTQVCKVIINEKWRETHFKLIHHSIFGFDIPLHLNCLDRLTACPKYTLPRTNLFHGVWLCPNIIQFWKQVADLFNTKMDINLANEPQTLLFHYFPSHIHLPVVLHVIQMSAKHCLLSKLLSPSLLSMRWWCR